MKKMFMLMLLFPNVVMASELCVDVKVSMLVIIVGNILKILQFSVPIILIIFGSIDFLKAMTSSSIDSSNKEMKKFIRRLIVGACVFLVPFIVLALVNLVNGKDNEIINCTNCLLSPKTCNEKVSIEREKQEENNKDDENNKDNQNNDDENNKDNQNNDDENNKDDENDDKFIISSPDITFSYEYDYTARYALYTPSTAKINEKTPLIVWLHGVGEVNASEQRFKNTGLLSVINNWSLEGFNAYVLCPISSGNWNQIHIINLIEKVSKEKNIDKDKIILVGHSMGAIGVQAVANNKVDYFSALLILSGYNTGLDLNQFKKVPVRAYVGRPRYGEDINSYNYTINKLVPTFGENNVTILDSSHANLPSMVFNLDKNNDNKSDIIEWMLSQ